MAVGVGVGYSILSEKQKQNASLYACKYVRFCMPVGVDVLFLFFLFFFGGGGGGAYLIYFNVCLSILLECKITICLTPNSRFLCVLGCR